MPYYYQNLKHQITFIENLNNNEFETSNWIEKLTTYAQIKALSECNFSKLENFDFGHIITEAWYLIKIRYLEAINSKMRVKFNDRIFEIKRIVNIDEKNKYINLITLEI